MSKKTVVLFSAATLCTLWVATVKASQPTVINFDNLSYNATLSGTNYAGLTWEWGNAGPSGNQGKWITNASPQIQVSYPYSQPYCVTNGWASTLMGIGFASPVNMLGAYFAGGGDGPSNWATGVRVHGYLDGVEVATTDWFNDIDTHPDWFAMNLNNVDRVVIEAKESFPGSKTGFYDMDNLTYEVPEPMTLMLLGFGATMLRRRQ